MGAGWAFVWDVLGQGFVCVGGRRAGGFVKNAPIVMKREWVIPDAESVVCTGHDARVMKLWGFGERVGSCCVWGVCMCVGGRGARGFVKNAPVVMRRVWVIPDGESVVCTGRGAQAVKLWGFGERVGPCGVWASAGQVSGPGTSSE